MATTYCFYNRGQLSRTSKVQITQGLLSSVRGLFGFAARLTATGDPPCPQHLHLQQLLEDTWMI